MKKPKVKSQKKLNIAEAGVSGYKTEMLAENGIQSANVTHKSYKKIKVHDLKQEDIEQQNQENMETELKSLKTKKKKVKKEKNTEVKIKDPKLLKKKALEYLKLWKKDRSNWKFEKLRQIWLLQNMFNKDMISERKFQLLLEYITPAVGLARKHVLDSATKVVVSMEKWTELSEQGLTDAAILAKCPDLQKVDQIAYNRARNILQSLQEECD